MSDKALVPDKIRIDYTANELTNSLLSKGLSYAKITSYLKNKDFLQKFGLEEYDKDKARKTIYFPIEIRDILLMLLSTYDDNIDLNLQKGIPVGIDEIDKYYKTMYENIDELEDYQKYEIKYSMAYQYSKKMNLYKDAILEKIISFLALTIQNIAFMDIDQMKKIIFYLDNIIILSTLDTMGNIHSNEINSSLSHTIKDAITKFDRNEPDKFPEDIPDELYELMRELQNSMGKSSSHEKKEKTRNRYFEYLRTKNYVDEKAQNEVDSFENEIKKLEYEMPNFKNDDLKSYLGHEEEEQMRLRIKDYYITATSSIDSHQAYLIFNQITLTNAYEQQAAHRLLYFLSKELTEIDDLLRNVLNSFMSKDVFNAGERVQHCITCINNYLNFPEKNKLRLLCDDADTLNSILEELQIKNAYIDKDPMVPLRLAINTLNLIYENYENNYEESYKNLIFIIQNDKDKINLMKHGFVLITLVCRYFLCDKFSHIFITEKRSIENSITERLTKTRGSKDYKQIKNAIESVFAEIYKSSL